jgi:hypothetical protein
MRRNQISSFGGRTSPFKSAGTSVQSSTGSRGARISGSNVGYTMFRGSVKSTGYPLHSPVPSFTSPPVRHRVPSRFNWTLPLGPIRSSLFLRRGYPGIAGSNTGEGMDVYLLWLLLVMQVSTAGRSVGHVYTSSATLRACYHLTQREHLYGHSL